MLSQSLRSEVEVGTSCVGSQGASKWQSVVGKYELWHRGGLVQTPYLLLLI
jgi:hypothetical protein